jgi:hypothetical protein
MNADERRGAGPGRQSRLTEMKSPRFKGIPARRPNLLSRPVQRGRSGLQNPFLQQTLGPLPTPLEDQETPDTGKSVFIRVHLRCFPAFLGLPLTETFCDLFCPEHVLALKWTSRRPSTT